MSFNKYSAAMPGSVRQTAAVGIGLKNQSKMPGKRGEPE